MPSNSPASSERETYDRLRTRILSLELLPGERLSERGLETALGASRTPIRAALMRLENEGLTRRAGRAWEVTPIDLDEVRAVMEYRETLERGIVELVTQRADPESLAALHALTSEHDDALDTEEDVLRDGGDFHLALAKLTENRFFVDAMRDALTRLSRTRWLEVRSAQSRALARDEHRAIAAAVTAGDMSRAAELSIGHNRGTRDRLLETLEQERSRMRGRGLAIVSSTART